MRWSRTFTMLEKKPGFSFHHPHGSSQSLVTQVLRAPTPLPDFYRRLHANHTDKFTYTRRHKYKYVNFKNMNSRLVGLHGMGTHTKEKAHRAGHREQ